MNNHTFLENYDMDFSLFINWGAVKKAIKVIPIKAIISLLIMMLGRILFFILFPAGLLCQLIRHELM